MMGTRPIKYRKLVYDYILDFIRRKRSRKTLVMKSQDLYTPFAFFEENNDQLWMFKAVGQSFFPPEI